MAKKKKRSEQPAETSTASAALERQEPTEGLDDIFATLAPKRAAAKADKAAQRAADKAAARAAAQADAARRGPATAAAARVGGAAAREGPADSNSGLPPGRRRKRERVIDPVFGEEYDLDGAVDPQNAQVHRIDRASGFNVYKVHHLGIGRGGGTPLCPFDCRCCF